VDLVPEFQKSASSHVWFRIGPLGFVENLDPSRPQEERGNGLPVDLNGIGASTNLFKPQVNLGHDILETGTNEGSA